MGRRKVVRLGVCKYRQLLIESPSATPGLFVAAGLVVRAQGLGSLLVVEKCLLMLGWWYLQTPFKPGADRFGPSRTPLVVRCSAATCAAGRGDGLRSAL
jgi:hypothetical protein